MLVVRGSELPRRHISHGCSQNRRRVNNATCTALAPAAVAMRPLLNRIVLHGIETCRGLLDEPGSRVRSPAGPRVLVNALATVALDRLAPELSAAGLTRTRRGPEVEHWEFGSAVQIHVTTQSTGEADSADAVAREYAVLLTRSVALDGNCSVRVSALPAQLALLWCLHVSADAAFIDSERLEDMVEIVMGRRTIVEDVAAAPVELRAMVSRASRSLAAHDGLLWVLRRALPDARLVPAVAARARERFARLGEFATA